MLSPDTAVELQIRQIFVGICIMYDIRLRTQENIRLWNHGNCAVTYC